MRDTVLWRKQARIIMTLTAELPISEKQACDLFFDGVDVVDDVGLSFLLSIFIK